MADAPKTAASKMASTTATPTQIAVVEKPVNESKMKGT